MSISEEKYIEIKKDIDFRLRAFKTELEDNVRACGRQMSDITLVGVSKFFPPGYAQAAYELGLKDLGENRVQELSEKISVLSNRGIRPNWHMIGTLQTNKVRHIIGKTTLIHSVDTVRLIEEIDKKSVQNDLRTSVLLQVNLSGEVSKHGFNAEETAEAIEIINKCSGVQLCGLMTMAPLDPSIASPGTVFEATKKLFEAMRTQVAHPEEWRYLSMGMSQDYIEALRYGATHIRIGTSIFGSRSL